MKKLFIGILALSSFLSLTSCKKKGDTSTKDTTKVTTKESTKDATTTKKITSDNPSYVSDYTPIVSDTLPRIDINTEENAMEWYTSVTTDTSEKNYVNCNVVVTDGENVGDSLVAQVKVRGNWTVTYPKKPLRIKFDKKQSMLGLNNNGKYKNWVLLAEFKDWSMLRNASAFYLAHLMGASYASDFRLVNVYLNNEYYGVYLLAEQQEVKEGRINVTEVEKNYEGTDIGYFVEYDGYYYREAENEQFTIDYKHNLISPDNKLVQKSTLQNGYTIKSDIYSNTQTQFIKKYIENVFDLCYNAIYEGIYYEFDSSYNLVESTTLTNAYDTISKVLDIDSLVNSYILADIACDVDIAWSSFCMNVDFGEGGDKSLRFESPWDFDSSFGNTLGCLNGQGAYAGAIIKDVHSAEVMNPWYGLFYYAPWFKTLVKEKFNAMKSQDIFTTITTFITTMSTKYEADFNANYAKWNNNRADYPDTEWELSQSPSRLCTTQKQSAEYLISWFNTRINYLNALYNE